MTVSDMLYRMNSRELSEWAAYFMLEQGNVNLGTPEEAAAKLESFLGKGK